MLKVLIVDTCSSICFPREIIHPRAEENSFFRRASSKSALALCSLASLAEIEGPLN